MSNTTPPSRPDLTVDDHSFRLFVESVKDYAIFMLDTTGRIVTWNPGAERTKGYSADEIVGQHISTFYSQDDIAAGIPQRLLETAAREGRAQHEGWRLRKDGSHFWADVVVTAVQDANGTLMGFAKVTRDMTEPRELREAERGARLDAEAASRAKDEFLAAVSHELRTPLNIIVGQASRLPSEKLDPEAASRAWEALERNVRLQVRLVEDLLDVSRICAGKLNIVPKAVDLSRVAEEALEAAQTAAQVKGIVIKTNIDPITGPIFGDPVRLHQVVWNLLANAIKFTSPGGTVTLRVGREATGAVARVSDTGIGIDPKCVDRVFDTFAQVNVSSTRAQSGLGLGLSIVKHLVEAHGGRVKASSEGIGRGATFEVCLPVAADPTLSTPALASGV
jgi:hypothetical protein